MLVTQPLQVEAILDTKVGNHTRKKDYLECLVKWKKRPKEDSTWMSVVELEAKGFIVVDLMNRGSKIFTLVSLMQEHHGMPAM